jgi:hypothetical protein
MKGIIIVLSFLIVSCTSSKTLVKNNETFFKSLKNHSKKKKCDYNFYENIDTINERLDFVNYEDDTIFLIQEYNIQTGEFYESIWNSKSKVEYKRKSETLEYVEDLLFPKYYYSLVENWNLDKIKEYEDQYGNNFGANIVKAYKVDLNSGNLTLNCVSFSSFFSLDLEN